ncbi:MAG: SDR family oxidoreductase [Pirellulaceae bacterium]|jgi:NAD(P)-dependent dehydrogenase (short-subunit alcohol dehydrogenase family)|nr:SDR family oxidoreductase [Pirellulaceae bacterium]
MGRFEGQIAIITGGALGIGGATARKLASEGASVFIADIDDTAAATNVNTIQQAGGTAVASHVDVSQSADIARMVNEAVDQYGRLDILVQNAFAVMAGESQIHGSALTVEEESWDYGIDILLKALYLGPKNAIPHMCASGGGNIINLASVHSFLQEPGMLVYEAAKAGVVGMTRQMATEFGPDGIRVNAIAPGHIVGEGLAKMWEANPSGLEFFANQYPVRRTGVPDDIANGIAFLCSDEASFITGHTLAIDGGLTVQLQEKFGARQGRYIQENPNTEIP